MLKRIVFVNILFLFLCFQLSYARSLSEIKKTKELKICYSDSVGIVEVKPTGCKKKCKNIIGPAHEISLAFATNLGVKPTLINIPDWNDQFVDVDKKIRKGESYNPRIFALGICDVLPTHLTKNEWRLKIMDFAILFHSKMVIITRKNDKEKFKNADDLKNKTVLLVKNSSYQTWVEKVNANVYLKNPIKIDFVEENEKYQLLIDGRADFTIADLDTALYLVNLKYKTLTTPFTVGEIEELGWGFAKSDQNLRKAAEDYFAKSIIDPNSQPNQIWKKWFGKDLNEFADMLTTFK